MKKISIIGIIFLVSISPHFRGLFHSFETFAFIGVAALLIVIYLFYKIRNNETIYFNRWFLIFGVLLIAAYALGFIKAVNPRENLNALCQYTTYILIFIILYDYFQNNKQQLMKISMITTAISGFLCAVIGIETMTGLKIWMTEIDGTRIGSTFQYANTASIYFAICIVFALTVSITSNKIFLGSLFVGIGNILLFAFFYTGSRGGFFVGMAVFLLMVVIFPSGYRIKGLFYGLCMIIPMLIFTDKLNAAVALKNNIILTKWMAISFIIASLLFLVVMLPSKYVFKKRANPLIIVPGYMILIFVTLLFIPIFLFKKEFVSLLPPILGSRLENFSLFSITNDINIALRLEFDKDALKIIANNWALGLGRGGWKALYQSVQEFFYSMSTVHNNYFEVFIEAGILGFITNIVLSVMALFYTIVSLIKAKEAELMTYFAGLLCSLLALIIHSAFDFDLTFISLALLLWILFAMAVPYNTNRDVNISKIPYKVLLVAICSILFSINAVYFTAGLNDYHAKKYIENRNYSIALAYYEEASRLDPYNSIYNFEMAKLYHYFSQIGDNKEKKLIWLEKARTVSEKSVNEFMYYPYYIETLVQIYLDLGMPIEAYENAQRLVQYQKYRSSNYELLAQSYIAAAEFYEKNKDFEKAKDLLLKCIEINNNPCLLESNVYEPKSMKNRNVIEKYVLSNKLAGYLNTALTSYKNLN